MRGTPVHARVVAAGRRLVDAGIAPDEAALDARLLAQHVLGWTSERFFSDAHELEPPDFSGRYDALLDRRAAREPLAYIVGHKEFWGLDFEVNRAVLIPRPETETILEAAFALPGARNRRTAVADVCTGSGCLAVAMAREWPEARVTATDLSAEALVVAHRNASRHSVADRIDFFQADLLAGITGPFDLIVCNPPYIPEGNRVALQPEVVGYEPALALFSGATGLDTIGRLIQSAPAALMPGGHLIVECGAGQSGEVERLVAQSAPLRLVEVRRDLQGIARTVIAFRHG